MSIRKEQLYNSNENRTEEVHLTHFEGYDVIEWIPGPDVHQKAQAVCLVLPFDLPKVGQGKLMLRLKSRRAVDELVAALTKHQDGVWPP